MADAKMVLKFETEDAAIRSRMYAPSGEIFEVGMAPAFAIAEHPAEGQQWKESMVALCRAMLTEYGRSSLEVQWGPI